MEEKGLFRISDSLTLRRWNVQEEKWVDITYTLIYDGSWYLKRKEDNEIVTVAIPVNKVTDILKIRQALLDEMFRVCIGN